MATIKLGAVIRRKLNGKDAGKRSVVLEVELEDATEVDPEVIASMLEKFPKHVTDERGRVAPSTSSRSSRPASLRTKHNRMPPAGRIAPEIALVEHSGALWTAADVAAYLKVSRSPKLSTASPKRLRLNKNLFAPTTK